jgi:sec-independent protein translocase protein TatC
METIIDFSTRFLLAFGAVFELPLFIAFLVLANIVTPRQLVKFGRWATVLSFAIGAVVTPGPDVTSQIAVSSALIGLYFVSIPISYLFKPRKRGEGESATNEPSTRSGVADASTLAEKAPAKLLGDSPAKPKDPP